VTPTPTLVLTPTDAPALCAIAEPAMLVMRAAAATSVVNFRALWVMVGCLRFMVSS
jgi:hypothetical protein